MRTNPMPKGFVCLMLALGLAMSGCVGIGSASNKVASATSSGPLSPADIDPDSPYGVVQGHVHNDEGLPVVGAQVGLQKTPFNVTTDPTGLFVIRDVPPDDYVVQVVALGYASLARAISVQRANITNVELVLGSVESSNAMYYQLFHFTGWYDCALSTAAWISSCSYPYTATYGTLNQNGVNLSRYGAPSDLQKNVFRFNFTIRQNMTVAIGEMSWTSSSAAATRMSLMFLCGDYDYVWDDCLWPDSSGHSIRYGQPASGPSPLRKVVNQSVFLEAGKNKGKWDLGKNPQIYVMNYAGLPFGCIPYNQSNPVGGATQCNSGLPSNEFQLAFQQKFDVWDSVFYNGEPPDDYTVLRDR